MTSKRAALLVRIVSLAAAWSWSSPALAREPREWALLDPDLSVRRRGWSLGAADIRSFSETKADRGLTLEHWGALRTTRGHGFAELRQSLVLRAFEGPTFVGGVAHALHAGLELGALELGTGVGVTPVGVDLARGRFSLNVLSPEASLRLGLTMGPLHVSLRGHVQYLARLFGREDAQVRGLTLDVGWLRRPSHETTRTIVPYHR